MNNMKRLGATRLDEAEILTGQDSQYSITLVWGHYDQNGLSKFDQVMLTMDDKVFLGVCGGR